MYSNDLCNCIKKVFITNSGRISSAYIHKCLINAEETNDIKNKIYAVTNFLKESASIQERIYCILNNVSEKQKYEYVNFQKGYRTNFKKFRKRMTKKSNPSVLNSHNPSSIEEVKDIICKFFHRIDGTFNCNCFYTEKVMVEYINSVTPFLENTKKVFQEKCYCVINNIDTYEKIPKCYCGNKRKFIGKYGYQEYCSNKCNINSERCKNQRSLGRLKDWKNNPEKYKEINKQSGLRRRGKPSGKLGKKNSQQWRDKAIPKIREYINNNRKNKPYEEIYGEEQAINIKHKLSISHKGIIPSIETRLKMIENNGNKHLEKKQKHREIRNNFVKQFGKGPQFNVIACKWFDWLNEKFNLKGQHALNGGEISCIGYFLDFYDLENKIIIEWNEKFHYLSNGELRKKDIERKINIKNYFNDSINYIIIKQDDFLILSDEDKINFFKKKLVR